jgi:integrase
MKKPYYRGGRQRAWFYDDVILVDGKPKRKQVRLTERCDKNDDSESAAFDEWNKRRKEQPTKAETTTATVNALVVKFLEWSKVNKAESTHQFYWTHCTAFADLFGDKPADDVTHDDIDIWLNSEGKPRIGKNGKETDGVTYRDASPTYKANACRALARCYNWGRRRKVKRGQPRLCTVSPLEDYEGRPVAERRATYIESEEWDRLLSAMTDEHFRDIAKFLRLTGCRPIEGRRLTAAHWDGERTVTFARKESKGGKRERRIYLDPQAAEIVARLAAQYPQGELFRTREGKPWKRDRLCRAFQRAAKAAGLSVSAYTLRHAFVTDGLDSADYETMAHLAGHVDSSMIQRTYEEPTGNRKRSLIAAAERVAAGR